MKVIRILICILLTASVSAAGAERPKVAVVLSGGGAKGVAHASVLEIIEKTGIPIDMVVGTSMGAIMGGLYSIGYTPQQLDSLARSMNWNVLLSDKIERDKLPFTRKENDEKYIFTYSFGKKFSDAKLGGVIQGQNLDNMFSELTFDYHAPINFDSLPIPFACVAVDAITGKEHVFRSGELQTAMRSSMSIPGAFTPILLDSMVLIDGGVVNNYPVDVARSMGADIVIGVKVQAPPRTASELVTAPSILNQIVDFCGNPKYDANEKDCDLNISVDVTGYSSASFNAEAINTLLRRGHEAAVRALPQLEELKRRIGRTQNTYNPGYKPLNEYDSIFISAVTFEGVEQADQNWLRRACKLEDGKRIPVSRLKMASEMMRSAQYYGYVSYRLLPDGHGGHVLHFLATAKRENAIHVGLYCDTEDIAAAQINTTLQFKTKVPTSLSVTARLGRRLGIGADFYVHTSPLSRLSFSYMFRHNEIEIYDMGRHEFNSVFNYNRAEIGYSSMNIAGRKLKLMAGLRYEYFDFKRFLFSHDDYRFNVTSEGFFSYFFGLRYETLDKKYFPSKGSAVSADYILTTDNFAGYKGHAPFSALSFSWKQAIPAGKILTIIPSVYGRVVFGTDIPYEYMNFLGGDYFGRYMPQQIPFSGMDYTTIQNHTALVARVELRQKVARKHFILETCNYALTHDDLRRIGDGRHLIGGSIGYGYDSMVGPLTVSFNISNETKKLGFYARFGFNF
ncbi:MAG: patatin-like phospholipase family protein [Alistipes putredinis]|nr:MAG: patatin-like phospholipase family protein [Alistipes putredinis]